jgi:hypothetical protein
VVQTLLFADMICRDSGQTMFSARSFQMISPHRTLGTTCRRCLWGVDDIRIVRIQLAQSFDLWFGSRRAILRRVADRVIPDQGSDAGFRQQRTDDRHTGVERELGALTKVEDSFFRINGRSVGIDQHPATIEDRFSKIIGYINRLEIRGTKRRHEEHKLQIRHSRVVDIQ